ncbi:cytochrome C biogenesis protein CcsA [Lysobacteraceae bacterium NML93-0399]|nr:cytochrome C biogenesis protein CcsA [Xanthomonadaceae bacterium NML93-0399]
MTGPFLPGHRLVATALLAGLLAACGSQDDPDAQPMRSTSSAGLPAGTVEAGEQAANLKSAATGQTCLDCHGAAGNDPIDPTYPKIGGQFRDYLAHSLQAYRDGDREHALMSQQATGLSDQQIADLAAYFAAQPSQLRDLRGVHDN